MQRWHDRKKELLEISRNFTFGTNSILYLCIFNVHFCSVPNLKSSRFFFSKLALFKEKLMWSNVEFWIPQQMPLPTQIQLVLEILNMKLRFHELTKYISSFWIVTISFELWNGILHCIWAVILEDFLYSLWTRFS